MERKFTTSKMNVVKEMLNILDCSCEARLRDLGFIEFIFPYTEEVIEAYKEAKDRVYTEKR